MATDTMYYESKKQRAVAEISKTSSLPNIVVNSSSSGSPKLIHIAKAAPVKQEEKKEPETSKPKKNFPKNDIGAIGKKNGMIFKSNLMKNYGLLNKFSLSYVGIVYSPCLCRPSICFC